MTIENLSLTSADTTRTAQEDTLLAPRFYTTDFDELDRLDVSSVRAEWDELIAEMRSDPNKGHFKRNDDWDKVDLMAMPEGLRKEFIDFLVSSLTAEFSGCVLYAEMKRRGKNPDVCELFRLMARDEADLRRCDGLINLETMGYTDRRPGTQVMPAGTEIIFRPGDTGDFLLCLGNFDSRALAETVGEALEIQQDGHFRVETFGLLPGAGWVLPDTRRSDHAHFWDRGLPAVLLTDTANLRSPHYHAASDRLETLDLPFLAAATRGVEEAARRLLDAD